MIYIWKDKEKKNIHTDLPCQPNKQKPGKQATAKTKQCPHSPTQLTSFKHKQTLQGGCNSTLITAGLKVTQIWYLITQR